MKAIEVSLKEIVSALLYHSFLIFLAVVVCTAVGAGLTYSRQVHGTAYEEELAAYDSMLELSKQKMTERVGELSNQKEQRIYFTDHVLNASGGKGFVTVLSMRIDYNPITVDIYQAANQYIALFNSSDFRPVLKNFQDGALENIDPKSLIAINEETQGVMNIKDPSMLTIRSVADREKVSQDIALAVFEHMRRSGEGRSASPLVQQDLRTFDLQQVPMKHSELISEHQEAVSQLDQQIQDARSDYETLERGRPNNLRAVLASAMIAGTVGFFASIIIVLLTHLGRLIVVFPEQIEKHLGIRYLSGVRRKPGKLLGRAGDCVAGKHLLFPDLTTAMQFAEASLAPAPIMQSKLLFVGTLSIEDVSKASSLFALTALGKTSQILVSGNVCKSIEGMRLLSEADTVILVESLRQSKLREVNRLVSCVLRAGKTIAGYVLV